VHSKEGWTNLGQLSVLSGSRDIFKTLTDQPKGQIISKAEEEGKGKGAAESKYVTVKVQSKENIK